MPKSQFAPSRFHLIFATFALLAALLVAGTAYYIANQPRGPISIGTALVGGPFSLTDQEGRKVTDKDFRGHYMLVFFGYTYCPDICPTELQVMSAALDNLGAKADDIQPIFISVDQQRDTPEVLKQYVTNFHPRLVGLTGSAEEIASVARAYRVYFSKVENNSEPDAYLMDHSTIMYLMDGQGKFVKHFTYSTDAAALAKAIEEAIIP
ncbi:MAG TPA: SCO family protein [Aestuariivirga sp.]|nr:SCO family protein [Aestuariivirga sp.]